MNRRVFLLCALSAIGFACPAGAAMSFHDPFPGTGGDVIGDPRSFDIRFANITITNSVMTVELGFNFGPTDQTTLDAYRYDASLWLSAGDFLFLENGVPKWGVPIADHAGSLNGGPASNPLFAGQLYEVLTAGGWLTARQTLNDPQDQYYRYDTPVWLRDYAGSLVSAGAQGFVGVSYLGGDGTVTHRFDVTIGMPTPPELFSAWQSNQLSFSFASATCGNDILTGLLSPALQTGDTPEPSTWILAATGLFVILRLHRRKS